MQIMDTRNFNCNFQPIKHMKCHLYFTMRVFRIYLYIEKSALLLEMV